MSLLCFHQASLTVWWIILRFMGDLPEPKKWARVPSSQDRFMPQELMSRKDRRLSNMVGLDQVGIKTLKNWMSLSLRHLNPGKTEVLVFSLGSVIPSSIKLSAKSLAVILTENGIQSLTSKSSFSLFSFIRKNKKVKPSLTLNSTEWLDST